MKLGSGPITRMYLWLRKKLRKKRNQHVSALLANADGLGRLIVKKGAYPPFLNCFSTCPSIFNIGFCAFLAKSRSVHIYRTKARSHIDLYSVFKGWAKYSQII